MKADNGGAYPSTPSACTTRQQNLICRRHPNADNRLRTPSDENWRPRPPGRRAGSEDVPSARRRTGGGPAGRPPEPGPFIEVTAAARKQARAGCSGVGWNDVLQEKSLAALSSGAVDDGVPDGRAASTTRCRCSSTYWLPPDVCRPVEVSRPRSTRERPDPDVAPLRRRPGECRGSVPEARRRLSEQHEPARGRPGDGLCARRPRRAPVPAVVQSCPQERAPGSFAPCARRPPRPYC